MDFLTQKDLKESGQRGVISHWLEAAIGVLAGCAPNQAVFRAERCWSRQLVKNTIGEEQRHRSAVHSHSYHEVCICVGGRALMEIADRMCVMEAPSVFFAPPGTPHCQARTADGAFHGLVWLTASGEEMLVVTSAYRPQLGWVAPARTGLQGKDVRRLSEDLVKLGDRPDKITLRTVRADLLEVVNRSYQSEVRREMREDDGNDGPEDFHEPVLNYVRSYIDNNLESHVTLQELGEMARLSPNYLNRLFKQWMGEPLHQYTIRRRMETARGLLREGQLLVKQIARRVGYDDPLYFSRAFHDYYGIWPSEVPD